MKFDVVIPQNNEQELVDMAEKLGWEGLVFYYPQGKPLNPILKTGIKIMVSPSPGLIIAMWNEGKSILDGRFDLIFDVEQGNTGDFIHNRASGLNNVIGDFMTKKNKLLGFSLYGIFHSPKPWVTIGRIQQNIRICKRCKVKMCIATLARTPFEMRSPHDLVNFFEQIGMDGKTAREAIEKK